MISINKDDFIETAYMKGLQVSLVASGDGTEIIYHKLSDDARWGLEPLEGWSALEYIIVLSGELKYPHEKVLKTLKPGQSFYSNPVKEHHIFQANGDTEFLYVTSKQVFHNYSRSTNELKDLAVSIEEKDGYTVDHCYRINKLSMKVAEALNFDSKKLLRLNMASFLHDVGKVKIPLSILRKPGKLTSEEWEIMKKHTTYGREMLEQTRFPLLIDSATIVEQHHERYDGKGYPKGLKNDKITIEAAIIAVVDSYDAMTTDRVYQKGRSKEEALEEILRCRGSMYNPEIVDIFMSLKNEID